MTVLSAVPEYKIVALRYATSSRRRTANNFLTTHDIHDAPMPMDFFAWAAISDDRVVLIDSGSDREVCEQRGHEFLRCPVEALKQIGVEADDVDDVILTHMHWDHIGNLEHFNKARFHVHELEMAHATGCSMCHPAMRRTYSVEQVCNVIRALYGGRVCFNSETSLEVAPGITVHHVGGHTPGLQVVRVHTARGYVLLASDAMHFYDNALLGEPFPVFINVKAYLDAFKELEDLADSQDHIIAGHDPVVRELYPAWSEETRDFATRLDVPPVKPHPRASLFARGG